MTDTHTSGQERGIDDLKLVGGHLALDFCNTTGAREREAPNERLHGYPDLVKWSVRAGALAPSQAEALLQTAKQEPDEAEAVLHRARALRETLFRTFAAVACGRPPAADDLADFNAHLSGVLGRLRLRADEQQLVWSWRGQEQHLAGMLWPIVRAAADLLTSDERGRLKICDGDACEWLFLDQSRNRSRRWCDMGDCGNLAKARRYRRRHGTEST